MASLNENGTPKVQSTIVFRHHHKGNSLQRTDTTSDSGINIATTGTVESGNYSYPFGTEFAPDSRTFVSGMSLDKRNIVHNGNGSGILFLEYLKQASGLVLEHVVTRAKGIHTSISTRQLTGPSGMVTVQERKTFFLDSDSGKASGLANWNVFGAGGNPTIAGSGTTDIDITPGATFDV